MNPWTFLLMILLTLWVCQRPDPRAQMEQCGRQLHLIGVALEKFRLGSEDKLYPRSLEEAYTKGAVPACPAAGGESYRLGYKPSSDLGSYVLTCQGDAHADAGLPPDYPRIAFGPHESRQTGEEESPSQNASPAASPSQLPAASSSPTVAPSVQTPASPTASASASPGSAPTPNP